jgi:hypothetical protein
MYAFAKSQGTWVTPWREDVRLGAVREGNGVFVRLAADQPWKGRLRFDTPRHRDHWNLPVNYTRLNEFPEWFTVDQDRVYTLEAAGEQRRKMLGAELRRGIPLNVNRSAPAIIRVFPSNAQGL